MKAKSEIFRGTFTSWETLRAELEEFLTQLGPSRVISVCADHGRYVVLYWDSEPQSKQAHEWVS